MLRDLILDIQVMENLGKKYMYYNTYRPCLPKNKKIRLPFFGKCEVHQVRKQKDDWRITVRVELEKAKQAVSGIAQHIAKLDQSCSIEILEK